TTPLAGFLEASAREWVLAQGLLPAGLLSSRFAPINVGLLTALSYPTAPTEMQNLFAQLLAWIFIQDDEVDNAKDAHDPERLAALYQRHLTILAGGAVDVTDAPVHRALADLRSRFAEHAEAE